MNCSKCGAPSKVGCIEDRMCMFDVPLKRYNVGLETTSGAKVGLIVNALNADDAIERARGAAGVQFLKFTPGATVQRRDPNGGNEWFDRVYDPKYYVL